MTSSLARIGLLPLFLSALLVAAEPVVNEGPEELDIERIKQKYWARGQEAQMGLVQNRAYTKEKKVEIGVAIGGISDNPFLLTRTLAVSAGYHLSELLSVHVDYGKGYVTESSAWKTFQQQTSLTPSANRLRSFVAAEARGSVLYGKLNFLGSTILYLDAYVSAGVGAVSTDAGTNPLLSLGIGQQVHVTQNLALNLAYKMYWHRSYVPTQNAISPAAALGLSYSFALK